MEGNPIQADFFSKMKQLNRGTWAQRGFLKAPSSNDFRIKKNKVIKLIFNRAARKKKLNSDRAMREKRSNQNGAVVNSKMKFHERCNQS